MTVNCSVCILTFNSGKTLERCLESVRDFSDIVILDGGSADGTREIAGEYKARIYSQNDDGSPSAITDFTAAREKLFNLARSDWRLWLDSDEWLSEEAREAVKKIIADDEKKFLYSLERKAVIDGRIIEHAYFYPEYCKRLFHRNTDVFFKKGKKVHEDLAASNGVSLKKINAVIYHNWSANFADLIKKDNNYLDLTILGKKNFVFRKKIWIALINVLKAIKVFQKSLFVYGRYGFKTSLPPKLSWRFVRYHLLYAKKIVLW